MAEDKPKAGAGHLRGMTQLGLAELRNAAYPESNVAEKHPPYGVWGHPTPQEITEARRGEDHGFEQEPGDDSVLGDRLAQAKDREVERDEMSKEQEKEPDIER